MNFVFGSFLNVGYWNGLNFGLFVIMGYQMGLLKGVIDSIPNSLYSEKVLRTLPAIMIAPIHRFTLLSGLMVSKLVLISIPFCLFLVVALFIYPCSFLTFVVIIIIFLLMAIIFMGIGAILGVFTMSNENIWRLLELGLYFLFWLSALNYPIEIFPDILQFFIKLNPLYYFFDILHFTWIENNVVYTIMAHPFHVGLLLSCALLIPLVGIYIFDKVFKKYGIEL